MSLSGEIVAKKVRVLKPKEELSTSMVAALPKAESSEHRNAFRVYWELGRDRTHGAVADAINVSRGTIARWAMAFEWDRRISEFESSLPFKVFGEDFKTLLFRLFHLALDATEYFEKLRPYREKRMNGDRLTAEEKQKMEAIIEASTIGGVTIRDIKDIEKTIDSIQKMMELYGPGLGRPSKGMNATQVNVETMNLVIEK